MTPIRQIEIGLENEGYEPGSFAFEAEKRKRQVGLCKMTREVASCWECKVFDHCELVKQHLRDLRFHAKDPSKE